MEKEQIKKCPKCGSSLSQKYGQNRSGSQRVLCVDCGKTYTLNPKERGYSQEIRDQAIKLHFAGASGRTVGQVMGMSKANIYNWAKKNPAIVDK